ncbi:MAG: prepilin-type N-terminal cleavage/methylation domain-containing protein [Candidatus Moranbacteria bacterium]|nr:prepilin-type N-terminal cleavage/methylation domain-containing protein [Candidatus Moranbacteria bacterium]
MQTKKIKTKGFSLIELMIVIAIIGIIITITAGAYQKNLQRRKAESISYEIQQAINTTRDFTLTGEVIGDQLPAFFKLKIIPNPKTETAEIQINAYDKNDSFINTAKTIELTDYNKNIEIQGNINEDIAYKTPNADLEGAPFTINVCGDQTCSNTSMKYEITINQNSVSIQ